jgi:hypothetical protein
MVEVIQSEWGDWWVVNGGRPIAVHLRGRSDNDTQHAAAVYAARLFPGEAVIARSFVEDRPSNRSTSAVDDLVAD